LIVIGLFSLFFIIGAFSRSAGLGILTLIIFAPLAALLYTVYTRVILEFIIVVFRIAEYNGELIALQRQQMGLPAHISSLGIGGLAPATTQPAPAATTPPPATTTPPPTPPPATTTPSETPGESTPPPTDAGGEGESAS
jgi:outer membrane biosynthesis protein TonB